MIIFEHTKMLAEYLENAKEALYISVHDDIFCFERFPTRFNINELPVLIEKFPKINLHNLRTSNIDFLHAVKSYKIQSLDLAEINLDLVDLVNLVNFSNVDYLSLSLCSSTKAINFNVKSLYIACSPINVNLTNCNLTQLCIRDSQCYSKYLDNFDKLQSLTELTIEVCYITEVPETIYNLINLQKLNLRENDISAISENIGNLTNLLELDLCHNHISELPKNIKKLTNLEQLRLSCNEFTKIPELESAKITSLIMCRNKISEINCNYLQSLKYLYITENLITILPKGMTVQCVDFRDNPIFTQCQEFYGRAEHDDLIKFSELKRLMLHVSVCLAIHYNAGCIIQNVCNGILNAACSIV